MSLVNQTKIWEVAEACGVCGTKNLTEVFTIHQKRYVQCAECQVVRLYDRVAVEHLDLLYSNNYYLSNKAVLSQQELEKDLANPTFAFRRKRLEKLANQSKRIFEIGCGDGNFLAYMRRNGWQIQGSEFSQTNFDFIKARHGIEIRTGDFTNLAIEDASLDTVAAYHVLEHIYAPLPFLHTVKRSLKPGGILHLQLPNFRCIDRFVSGNCWEGLRFPEHIYFYSPASLNKVLETTGFRVLNYTTYDPWHSPGSMLASLRNTGKHYLTKRTNWLDWPSILENRLRNTDSNSQTSLNSGRRPKATTRLFDLTVFPLMISAAKVESLAGFGNVIDVVAKAL